jgi:hypothetical protein
MKQKLTTYFLIFTFIVGLLINNPAMAFYPNRNSEANNLDIWYTNSQTATGAGNVNINSGKDTTVRGANIQGSDVNIDTTGALTVESLQDEHHGSSSSKGFNVGLSFSGAQQSTGRTNDSGQSYTTNTTAAYGVSLGYNRSNAESDAAWVNNQTSIIGTNSVTVNADAIHNKGAVIANITEEGTDGGNVLIAANKITYEDIHDYNNSYETGFGIQTNLSIGGKSTTIDDASGKQVFIDDFGNYAANDKGQVYTREPKVNPAGFIDNAVDSVLHPSGSTTITVKNTGHEIEQETRATIGEGTIRIEGEIQGVDSPLLANLNRDLDKSQEITKDEIIGALDYSITIDHKVVADVVEIAGKYGYKLATGVAKGIAKVLASQNKDAASASIVPNTGVREEYHKEDNVIAHYDEDGKLTSMTAVAVTQNEDGTVTLKYSMSDDSLDNMTAAGITNAASGVKICVEGYCLPTYYGEQEISNLNIYDAVIMSALPVDVQKIIYDGRQWISSEGGYYLAGAAGLADGFLSAQGFMYSWETSSGFLVDNYEAMKGTEGYRYYSVAMQEVGGLAIEGLDRMLAGPLYDMGYQPASTVLGYAGAAYIAYVPEEYRNSLDFALDISGMAGLAYGGVRGVAALGSTGKGLIANEIGALGDVKKLPSGGFKVTDWAGYPEGLPKPKSVTLLEGTEYKQSRNAANYINRQTHIDNPELDGYQIHEIQPVKLGGSPRDVTNKIVLTPAEHHNV